MGGDCLPFDLLDVEDKDREFPLSRHLRILLSEAAGSGVSGIFKGLFLIFQLAGDQLLEDAEGHIHFPTYLQVRKRPGELFRDVGNGEEV